MSDPSSRPSPIIHESLQPFSLSLQALLPLQVGQFLIRGIPTPAVGTVEQRRVIEPHALSASTAIRFRTPLEPKHTYLGSLFDAFWA